MKLALLLAALTTACALEYTEGGSPSYSADAEGMANFFAQRCDNCHGYDPGQAGLQFPDDVADVVVPGDPDASLLWQALANGDMPPGNRPLPPALIEHVYEWIADGAVMP